jgi:hypothetical protein
LSSWSKSTTAFVHEAHAGQIREVLRRQMQDDAVHEVVDVIADLLEDELEDPLKDGCCTFRRGLELVLRLDRRTLLVDRRVSRRPE